MKPELEHKLIEKYPDLFKNRNKSPKESLMCFGCEHGDGWFTILKNLCGYIENIKESRTLGLKLRDEFKTEENHGFMEFGCPNIIFDQIKEKYGTLRVYWHFDEIENYEEIKSKLSNPEDLDKTLSRYSDRIENAIEFGEYLSSITCEITGKPGKLYTEGWCVTLCPEEALKKFGHDPEKIDI